MNHYDDLQRFQEKTRTQNLKFQDLSSQTVTQEHGGWAILDQLSPDARELASLALGGSVSMSLSQPMPVDLFQRVDLVIAAPAPPLVVPTPLVIAAIPPPVIGLTMPEPVASTPAMTVGSLVAAPVLEPVMASPPKIASRPASGADNYAHLLAVKTAESVAENKDQPLKSLLERIATYR